MSILDFQHPTSNSIMLSNLVNHPNPSDKLEEYLSTTWTKPNGYEFKSIYRPEINAPTLLKTNPHDPLSALNECVTNSFDAYIEKHTGFSTSENLKDIKSITEQVPSIRKEQVDVIFQPTKGNSYNVCVKDRATGMTPQKLLDTMGDFKRSDKKNRTNFSYGVFGVGSKGLHNFAEFVVGISKTSDDEYWSFTIAKVIDTGELEVLVHNDTSISLHGAGNLMMQNELVSHGTIMMALTINHPDLHFGKSPKDSLDKVVSGFENKWTKLPLTLKFHTISPQGNYSTIIKGLQSKLDVIPGEQNIDIPIPFENQMLNARLFVCPMFESDPKIIGMHSGDVHFSLAGSTVASQSFAPQLGECSTITTAVLPLDSVDPYIISSMINPHRTGFFQNTYQQSLENAISFALAGSDAVQDLNQNIKSSWSPTDSISIESRLQQERNKFGHNLPRLGNKKQEDPGNSSRQDNNQREKRIRVPKKQKQAVTRFSINHPQAYIHFKDTYHQRPSNAKPVNVANKKGLAIKLESNVVQRDLDDMNLGVKLGNSSLKRGLEYTFNYKSDNRNKLTLFLKTDTLSMHSQVGSLEKLITVESKDKVGPIDTGKTLFFSMMISLFNKPPAKPTDNEGSTPPVRTNQSTHTMVDDDQTIDNYSTNSIDFIHIGPEQYSPTTLQAGDALVLRNSGSSYQLFVNITYPRYLELKSKSPLTSAELDYDLELGAKRTALVLIERYQKEMPSISITEYSNLPLETFFTNLCYDKVLVNIGA